MEFVKNFLVQLQIIYKEKEIRNQMDKSIDRSKNNHQNNKVFLLVVKQNQHINHFCQQKQLSLHEIFFCLQETTVLELQTFVLRSLRGRNKKYLIIGAQWLSVEVKNQLLNIITQYYRKSNDNQNDRKLYFIDNNNSDTLYCYLNWSLEIDYKEINEKSLLNQQVKKVEINLIQHYFRLVKLVTSAKPGLGKTYFVQREAANKGKKLVYFPICGNVNLQTLFKRLKAKDIDQNSFLLIQLGYFSPEQQKSRHNVMVNMRKLQIFLMEIIIFRKFYLEGDYINIPKQTSIFIQIQNLLESALYLQQNKEKSQIQKTQQKYNIHLLNLLERFQAKHHINNFQLDRINLNPQSLKDIFVLKYLQLLDFKKVNTVNLLFRDLQPKVGRQDYEKFKGYLHSNQFMAFFASLSDKTQFAKEISLQQKMQQKISIDSKLIEMCIKALLKFNPKQWQLYQEHITNEGISIEDIKLKVQLLQDCLQTLEKEIQNYEPPAYPKNYHHLLNKYFKNRHDREITYRTYRYFMNILFEKINTFSQSSYLKPQCFQYGGSGYIKPLEINKIRQNFLSGLITNTSKLLQQTTFTSIRESISEFYPNLQSQSTIILSAKDNNCYQFVYKQDKKVDFLIKTLLATQTSEYVALTHQNQTHTSTIKEEINQLFHKESFNNLKEKDQEKKIMDIFYSISQNKNFLGSLNEVQKKVQGLSEYRLTKDNFFKICYIIQKATSNIPIIIMGQSGVGKTALINFLVKQIFNEVLIICNVHAGIHQQQLGQTIEKAKRAAAQNKDKRVWVFFDEYNTTDELSYIKQIVIDRRFLGEDLPQNLIFCTACNPYRMRLNTQTRAFNVKPPNLSMVTFMWDFQQLKQQECKQYCLKMLKQIEIEQKKHTIIDTVVKLHQIIHKRHQKSYASLRDVARFKQIYHWFLKSLSKQPLTRQYHPTISMEFRSLYLAYYFVYILKISHYREKEDMIQIIEQNFSLDKGFIQTLVKNQQTDFTMRLKQPNSKIAYNKALRQNVFTTIVCILNKIPILLLGKPGSSKSLSIKLINSNLRGKFSSNQFCRQFPELLFHYFQGSQSSTSEGILKVFDVTTKKKPINTQYCILFDQIGLAGKSIHNPLKVMHSKIETHNKDISIIAISNEKLDSAKMSRFLTVSRQEMDREQLIETAEQIYKAYIPNDQSKLSRVKKIAQNFYTFTQDQKGRCKETFYGLRDFYCLIKYICGKFAADMKRNQDEVLRQAIRINFDTRREVGQKESKDYQRFIQIADLRFTTQYKTLDDIIKTNISEQDSRYLLFAIQQNSIVYLLTSKKIEIKEKLKKITCMYGSPFSTDNSSQQYNIWFTSKIIGEASNGGVIAIKDLNNSIQTSLYDLFNKSFTTVGKKMYCRVAVGDKSNPRCHISPQFLVIVFVMKDQLSKLDSPFLNRFEKHSLNILDELTQDQKSMLQDLEKWIQSIQQLWSKCSVENREIYLLNTSRQCLASLICSSISSDNENSVQLKELQKKIIQNSTSQLDALLRKVYHKQTLANKILSIKAEINEKIKQNSASYDPLQFQGDTIIYTYNNFQEMMNENQSKEQSVKYLKISQNQKQLKQMITQAILTQRSKIIQINCNFEEDKNHLDYLLHLVKTIKQDCKQQATKRIRIVIQLNRYLLLNYSRQQQHRRFPFKINISYLHPFQQFFYDISMEKIIKFNSYSQLISVLFTDKMRQKCIVQSINYFNIVSQDSLSPQQCIKMLYKTSDDPNFTSSCKEFMCRVLKKDEINYSEFMLKQGEKKDDNNANNFRQLLTRRLQRKINRFYKIIIYSLVKSKTIHLFNIANSLQKYYEKVKDLQFGYYDISQSASTIIKKHFSQLQKTNLEDEIQKNLVFSNKFKHPLSYEIMSLVFYDQKLNDVNNIQFITKQLFIKKQIKQRNYKESFIADPQYQNKQQKFYALQGDKLNFKTKSQEQKFMILTDVVENLILLLKLNKQLAIPVAYLLRTIQKYSQMRKLQGSDLFNQIILLTMSRDYWKLIIEILAILLEVYQLKELAAQLQLHYTKYQAQSGDVKESKFYQIEQILKNCFECFVKSVFDLGAQAIVISNYNKFGKKYLTLSQEIFKKMGEIVDLNKASKIFDFQIPHRRQAELKLIELFVGLNKSDQNQLLKMYIKKTEGKFSYVAVAYFCQELLKAQVFIKSKKYESKIIYYLAYSLFGHFCDQFKQLGDSICSEMIQIAKKIATDYPQFANLLSLSFFPKLLPEKQKKKPGTQNLQIFFKFLEKEKDKFSLGLNQMGNFIISLSLHLRNFIKGCFADEEQDYTYAHKNLNDHYQFYEGLMGKQRGNRISELFKNQFLKIYLQNYIDIILFDGNIEKKKQRKKLQQINESLQSNNGTIIITHLKIYLFKYIYSRFKTKNKSFDETVKIISQKSQENLFSWLQFCVQFLGQHQNINYYLPFNIYNHSSSFLQHFKAVQDGKFKPLQTVQLIKQGLKSPENTYDLLTLFATVFYTEQIHENHRKTVRNVLDNLDELKRPENQVVKTFLVLYIRGRIIQSELQYRREQIQQYKRILPLLNFLNLLVSYRLVQNCYIEMFFCKGIPIKNLQQELKDKFVFGVLNNPQIIRCFQLANNNADRTDYKMYKKCLNKECDYVFELQSSEYINIEQTFIQAVPSHMRSKSMFYFKNSNIFSSKIATEVCPLCLQQPPQIDDLQPGDAQFELNSHLQQLKTKTVFKQPNASKEHSLVGLNQMINKQDIFAYKKKRECLESQSSQQELNNKFSLLTSNTLELVFYFVWWVFSSIKQIDTSIIKIYSPGNLKSIWQAYYAEIENQEIIPKAQLNICLYGICNFIKNQLNQSHLQNKKSTLLDQTAKIQFSGRLQRSLAFALGQNSENFIKENIYPRHPTSEDIVKQEGLVQLHKNQYKQIELFRIYENTKISKLKDFNSSYLSTLTHTYPALYSMLYNIQKIQQIYKHLKNIYVFVYRVWMIYNFELKRQCQKLPINQILSNKVLRNDITLKKKMQEGLTKFYESWNYFADKLNFKVDERKLRKYQKNHFPLQHFIIDRSKAEQQSQMLGFITKISQEYNTFCLSMQQMIRKHCFDNNKQRQVFNRVKVNPTFLSSQREFWSLTQKIINKHIKKNSHHSVIYGNSKYQFQFELLQNSLIKQFSSTHYLTSPSSFKRFNFIDSDPLQDMKQLALYNQKLTDKDISNINKLHDQNKSTEEQFLQSLRYSLQKIIHYLKYFKSNPAQAIGEFLKKQQENFKNTVTLSKICDDLKQATTHPFREIDVSVTQDPISPLPMSKIIDLFEYITKLQQKNSESKENEKKDSSDSEHSSDSDSD